MLQLRNRFIVLLTAVVLFAACGGTSDYERRRNETRALSYLKKFQTAATLYQVEFGRYGTLEELRGDDLIESALYSAWDALENPRPLGGFLYTHFVKDSERVGMCAYPSEPGTSGDLMICTLVDPRYFQAQEYAEDIYISHGEEWNFYTTDFASVGEPLRHWPDDRTLESRFTRIEKRSPEEGLAEARRLAETLP